MGETFPIVYAEAESGLIRGIETLHQASRVEPYTELRVEHNDGSYYTFIVRFLTGEKALVEN